MITTVDGSWIILYEELLKGNEEGVFDKVGGFEPTTDAEKVLVDYLNLSAHGFSFKFYIFCYDGIIRESDFCQIINQHRTIAPLSIFRKEPEGIIKNQGSYLHVEPINHIDSVPEEQLLTQIIIEIYKVILAFFLVTPEAKTDQDQYLLYLLDQLSTAITSIDNSKPDERSNGIQFIRIFIYNILKYLQTKRPQWECRVIFVIPYICFKRFVADTISPLDFINNVIKAKTTFFDGKSVPVKGNIEKNLMIYIDEKNSTEENIYTALHIYSEKSNQISMLISKNLFNNNKEGMLKFIGSRFPSIRSLKIENLSDGSEIEYLINGQEIENPPTNNSSKAIKEEERSE